MSHFCPTFVLPLSSGITKQRELESSFRLFVVITAFTDNVSMMLVVELVVVFMVNFATLSKMPSRRTYNEHRVRVHLTKKHAHVHAHACNVPVVPIKVLRISPAPNVAV